MRFVLTKDQLMLLCLSVFLKKFIQQKMAVVLSNPSKGSFHLISIIILLDFPQLNPDVNAFQRKFVNEVRRCDEMERKLREFFQSSIMSSWESNREKAVESSRIRYRFPLYCSKHSSLSCLLPNSWGQDVLSMNSISCCRVLLLTGSGVTL